MPKDQLITDMEKIAALPAFEGMPTIATSLEVRGIEGGFNDGLAVDPVVLHYGDRVYLLLEGVVDGVAHKPVKDADGWRRAHVIKVETGTLVDAEFADDRLETHRLRVEEARGIARLPWDGDGETDDLDDDEPPDDEDSDEAVYARNHAAGNHADGLVDGCPSCNAELDALAAEGVVE